jgi:DNA gyrase subunit A
LRLIDIFVEHRVKVLNAKFNAELTNNNARIHILDGLISVSNRIDETIKIIRGCDVAQTAIKELILANIVSTEIQAKAVLAITLGQLTRLETHKLTDEKEELV